MKLREVLRGVEFGTDGDTSNIDVSGIAPHAKSVKKGSLFIATSGYRFDGHDFIGEAIRKGARAIVAERDFAAPRGTIKVIVKNAKAVLPVLAANFYGHPSRSLRIIGITGTNGKTTVAYLVERILKTKGFGVGLLGTIDYHIGEKTIESKNTTPGAIELQAIFREMVDSKLECVVMEVSSHALDQNRIGGVEFEVAAFTNITREHLDYHKTIGNYMEAKSKIFGYLKKGGFAVLNSDDPRVFRLRRSIENRVITYGIKKRSKVMARDISVSLDGSTFTIETGSGGLRIRTRLMGLHNISNILAATGIAIASGVEHEYIKKGLEGLALVPGRLESVGVDAPFRIFVDYAHTDDALYNVLTLLAGLAPRGIITVFGCGGDRDKLKRPRMGRVACELSDKVVITSDNPRSEDPRDIIADITKGTRGKFSNFLIEEDRAEAIKRALRMARKGDIVLIAGKGHERYQIVGDKMRPFDDREVVKSYFGELCALR